MARAVLVLALLALAVFATSHAQDTDAPGVVAEGHPETIVELAEGDTVSRNRDGEDEEEEDKAEAEEQPPRIKTEEQAEDEDEEKESIADEQDASDETSRGGDSQDVDEHETKKASPSHTQTHTSTSKPTPLPKTAEERDEEAAHKKDEAEMQKFAPQLKATPTPTPAPKKPEGFDPAAEAKPENPHKKDALSPGEQEESKPANNQPSASQASASSQTTVTREGTTETTATQGSTTASTKSQGPVYTQKGIVVTESKPSKKRIVPMDCEFCVQFVLNNVQRAANNHSHLVNPCPDHKGLLRDACAQFAATERVPLAVALDPEIVCTSIEMCKKEDAKKLMSHLTALPMGKKLRFSGTVEITAEAYNMGYLNKGTGERTVIQRVPFDSVPFDMTPMVHVALSSFDIDDSAATRVNVEARNIGRYGMDVVVTTWGKSRINRLSIDWFAYSTIYAAESSLRSGRMSVKKPPRMYLKRIFFPKAFTTVPEVTVAIAGLHVLYGGANDVNVKVQSLNEGSMEVLITAGEKTQIEWIRLAWTAYMPEKAMMWSERIHLTEKTKGFAVMGHFEQPKRRYEQQVRYDKRMVQSCPAIGAAVSVVKPADEKTVPMKGCHIKTIQAPHFKVAPWILTEISNVRFDRDSAIDVTTHAADITEEGFTLVVIAGPDVVLDELEVQFIAIEKPLDYKPNLPQSEKKTVEITPEALNSPDNPGRSCRDILVKKASRGNGVYWIRVFGGEKVQVFCDMTGGGWTRVVNIHGDSYFHADNTTAVNIQVIFDEKKSAKLSDQMINTMDTTGYWKMKCGSYVGYVRNDKVKWTSHLDNDYEWHTTRHEDLGLKWECDATENGYVFSDENSSGHGECEQEDSVAYAAPTFEEGTGCKHGGEGDGGWAQDGSLWVK